MGMIFLTSDLMKAVKGQLISKCPNEKSKIPTKIFLNFCPEFFVVFWGLPGGIFGLPVAFLIYDIIY